MIVFWEEIEYGVISTEVASVEEGRFVSRTSKNFDFGYIYVGF